MQHSHPSGFTWGNTASSAIFVLPTDQRPPHLWWAAATPCTSVYVPVFVDAGRLPELLLRAGTARTTSCIPESAPPDTPADDSYWWTFRRLLDAAKGDTLGSASASRQSQVRDAFDLLETAWRAELDDVVETTASAPRPRHGRDAAADTLAAFTRRCVDRAVATAHELLEQFTRADAELQT